MTINEQANRHNMYQQAFKPCTQVWYSIPKNQRLSVYNLNIQHNLVYVSAGNRSRSTTPNRSEQPRLNCLVSYKAPEVHTCTRLNAGFAAILSWAGICPKRTSKKVTKKPKKNSKNPQKTQPTNQKTPPKNKRQKKYLKSQNPWAGDVLLLPLQVLASFFQDKQCYICFLTYTNA